jgi:hypothetical protein
MPTDTLANMVRNLRSEAGHSLSVAQGQNQLETLKYLLRRTQEELWVAFQWPDLKVRSNVAMAVGQYFYPYDTVLGYDQIREAWWSTANSAEWSTIGFGVTEDMIKPDNTNTMQSTPVQFWDVYSETQFRVWPTPSQVGTVRFVGNKPIAPFTADADRSTLDATLIVLFAGAELLARAKAEDAPMKQQKAQRHLLKLLGNKISAKNKVSTLGARAGRPTPTPGIDYIPMVS